MDGSLVWKNQHHQSGTLMPLGAVHPIIASEAKQSIAQQVEKWIASLALAMTAKRLSGHCLRQTRSVCAREQRDEAIHGASQVENWIASLTLATTQSSCLKIESVARAAQRATLLRLLDRPGHAYRDLKRFFALRYRRCRRRDPLDVPAIGHRTGSAFLRNAKRFAERDAGSFGVDLGLAACIGERLFASAVEQFRGVRHRKTDAADIVSAGTNEGVDHPGELVDVAKAHHDAIAGPIADDGRGCGAVGRVLRLQR